MLRFPNVLFPATLGDKSFQNKIANGSAATSMMPLETPQSINTSVYQPIPSGRARVIEKSIKKPEDSKVVSTKSEITTS